MVVNRDSGLGPYSEKFFITRKKVGLIEYFHSCYTKDVYKRQEELDNDQWKRYEIFQDTLGGRPYLFNGGLPPGGSDGSGSPGIDYQITAEALTDEEFAAIYKEDVYKRQGQHRPAASGAWGCLRRGAGEPAAGR